MTSFNKLHFQKDQIFISSYERKKKFEDTKDFYFIRIVNQKGQTIQYPREKAKRTNNTISTRKGQKDKQYNIHEKRPKGQTMIYNALHRKLKIEQHEPH